MNWILLFRSPWENLCLIIFIAGALYAVMTVRNRALYISKIYNTKYNKDGHSKYENYCQDVVVGDIKNETTGTFKNIKNRRNQIRYCRICQHNVPDKDHHCVWVDACISHTNIYPFMGFLGCIYLTLIHAGLLFLTSVCDHASLSSLLSVPWSSEVTLRFFLWICNFLEIWYLH